MISDAQLIKHLEGLMHNFPRGQYVWHRADGRRGIVMGYLIIGWSVLVRVSYGEAETNEVPIVLSATKVLAASEGEEWQTAE